MIEPAEPGKRTGTKRTGFLLCLLLTTLFSAAALFFVWKIADHLIDERRSLDYWDELQDSVVITSPETQDTRPVTDAQEQTGDADGAAEPEIPAAIDFDSLHAISGNAVAWIFAPGTNINYVIAQSNDNAYYLRRLLDGTAASGGTLFADYRCSADLTDWNTVIYGHQMKNGTMFGSLTNYRDPGYYAEHPVMYLYVPGKRYRLELIAGYTTDIYDAAYSVPASKEQRDTLLARAAGKSSFLSGVTVGEEDRLVTLSTCSYDYNNARYVVIGRLVED